MSTIKTTTATLLAIGAVAAMPTTASARKHPYCTTSGYVKGTVGGKTKCLHVGEACSRKHLSDYRRYGFVCVPAGSSFGSTYLLRKG